MAMVLVIGLIGLQLLLTVFSPSVLITFSLLTGPLPMSLGREDLLSTPLGHMNLNPIRLLGLCMAMLLVLAFNGKQSSRYASFNPMHLVFLGFCVLALVWAPSPAYGIRMIAKLSAPYLFLLFILTFITSHRELERMERVIVAVGILVLLGATIAKSLGMIPDADRFTIPLTSAAGFSALLAVVALLALGNARYKGARHLFVVMLMTAGILVAQTRSTIGALFIGASAMFFFSFRGVARIILPIGGLVGFVALFFLSKTFKERMFFGADEITLTSVLNDPSWALDHVAGSGRFAAWDLVLERFFYTNPLIGSGTGATQHFFYTNSFNNLGVIHSEYIRLLAEVGIAGLILFVLTLLVYFIRLARIYRTHPQSDSGRLALISIGGLIAYAVFMGTDNAFDYVNLFGIYVFGLIAMSEKARELEVTAMAPAPAVVSDATSLQDTVVQEPVRATGHYPVLTGTGQDSPSQESVRNIRRYPLLTEPGR